MADSSFDIEAGVDHQEVDNAINQSAKEVAQRFDFRDTETSVEWAGDEGVTILSSSEDRARAALDVFKDKCIKRKVSLKALEVEDPREVGSGRVRIDIALVTTMPADLAKKIVKDIKQSGLKKVTPTNMGDKIRVVSKNRDDLQAVQKLVKGGDHPAPLKFTNYK